MTTRDPQARPRAGRMDYVSDDDAAALYEAALEIIGEIGMRVHQAEALDLLREAGCEIAEPDLVRIPRELVERARASAPAAIDVYDRLGEPAMSLGGYASYFGTGSDLMSTYDLETGEHRRSVLADVGRAAHLCDALPSIDFVMSCAYPNDVKPERANLASFLEMVRHTTKPMVVTCRGLEDLRVMWEVACTLRGGAEELRARPYFIMYGEPTSPLRHPADSLERLLFCAEHGIPAIYSPAPLAGGTAPLTTAGHIAQGTAESLFGLVIHQLRHPGAPFIFGIGPAVLDMGTMQSSYNAPEFLTGLLGAVGMARWLDMPNWGYGGTTDAQTIDAQAGMEAAELALLSVAAGSNLNHDVGYLDFGLTASLELVVIVDEYLSLNRRIFAGIEVTSETLALETVRQVGPGGDFLATRHTARHVRTAQWRPTILNRQGRLRWEEEGGLDLRERARRKALDLLAQHEPVPLGDDLARRVDELAAAFRPEA